MIVIFFLVLSMNFALAEKSKIVNQIYMRLIRSFMDLLILSELKERSLSGYDIFTLIHDRFSILISPGSVYSVLYSMERDGLIKGDWRSRKRLYKLTVKGELVADALLSMRDRIEDFISKIFLKGRVKGEAASYEAIH